FQATPEQMARDLAGARRAVDPALPRGCQGEDILVRAPLAVDAQARMALAMHLRGCDACRRALAAGEALDARLRETIEREAAQLPALPPAARPWRLRASWLGALAAGVLLLTLVVAGAGAALARWAPRGGLPIPLVTSAAQPPSGWLVRLTQQRQLQAVSLDGTRTRPLQDLDVAQGFVQPLISPKGDLVALADANVPYLEFARLGGKVISTHTFEDSTFTFEYNSAGWLDDGTFLVIAQPLYRQGESQAFYEMRAAGQTRLLAVDAASGGARQLFQGDLCAASPSPDGTRIALAVCAADGGPATLDLRPVTPDGLGPPIAHLERELRSQVVWSPDSRRCYFASGGAPPQNPLATPAPLTATPYALHALDRDGRLTTLAATQALALNPVTVTPDGANLVYDTLDGTPSPQSPTPTLHLWRLPLDGGEPVQLATITGAVMPSNALWSPDGHTLLLPLSHRYFLSESDTAPAANSGNQYVTELLTLGPDWTPRPLATELDGYASWVLRWLPEDALPPLPAPRLSGHAAAPEPVKALTGYQLDPGSSASPDGRYAIVAERDSGFPAVLPRDGRDTRSLLAGTTDLTWLPDGSGAIGVAPASRAGDPKAAASRLTLYANAYLPNTFPLDFHSFDPARLGAGTQRRYARPLVAPGGDLLSFFVVDPARQRITLWLTGWDLPPRQVSDWPLPAAARDALPPVAAWADGRTLIVARPDRWRGSLPQAATLLRVSVDPANNVAITPLVTLTGHGSDHGIALVELALSPDGSRLAYRLRHFTGSNLSGPHDDSLRVAPASDLRQSLELARGAPGQGLAWAPDSAWLAAPLHGQLLLLAADGSSSQTLTPAGKDAAGPIWLGDQLWVSLNGDAGPEIWQVPLN
ncbi:MAG TPA: hypothetical protein VFI42_10035, partial [Thermomicrobiaceae bacterium]|nr:hypothetical protein [Thermomicrobiaceae bacterium]